MTGSPRYLHTFRRRAAVVLAAAVLAAVSQANGAAAAPPGSEVGPPAGSEAASVSTPEASATELAPALAAGGIPSTAHEAYVRAAAASPGTCHIAWPLVAAIGRVESNHGRFAGAVLHTDGRSTPPIIGRALDGKGTALIRDTDGGQLDGDRDYDRAVGPMQFIPSTWRSYATDGDGDARSDPFDIHDAAVAAAKYLCAAGRDLSSGAGKKRAVLAYNHSTKYVKTVLKLAAAYARKPPPILPTPPPEPTSKGSGVAPAQPPAVDEGPPPAAAPASAPDAPTSTPTPEQTTPEQTTTAPTTECTSGSLPGAPAIVDVRNGSGDPALATELVSRLAAAGIQGIVTTVDAVTSAVQYPDGQRPQGGVLAAALGLVGAEELAPVDQVTVVIGARDSRRLFATPLVC